MSRDLIRKLKAAGWTLTKVKRGHIHATPPGGGPKFFLAGTPSDRRGDKNDLSRIKRSGYVV